MSEAHRRPASKPRPLSREKIEEAKAVFNDRKAPVQTDRPLAFPSMRSASVIRRPDSGQRLSITAAQTSLESAERSDSSDRLVAVVGVALSVILTMSAFAAIAHIWVNAGMIR